MMKILLAGLNIDHTILMNGMNALKVVHTYLRQKPGISTKTGLSREQLTSRCSTLLKADNLTPETLSAAYARTSRDPRPINLLREESRFWISKARRSNRRIVFGMGHASIAEHAVFNIDIIGVSRLIAEYIQQRPSLLLYGKIPAIHTPWP